MCPMEHPASCTNTADMNRVCVLIDNVCQWAVTDSWIHREDMISVVCGVETMVPVGVLLENTHIT